MAEFRTACSETSKTSTVVQTQRARLQLDLGIYRIKALNRVGEMIDSYLDIIYYLT